MESLQRSLNEEAVQEFKGIKKNDTLDLSGVQKYTSFILLKKKSLFGYVYFFERRRDDDSFGGKLALFGGSRDPDKPESSHEAILDNELGEELGLEGILEGFISKFYLISKRENGEETATEVFALEEKVSSKLRLGKLQNAQQRHVRKAPNDPVGKVVKIRRVGLNWWWFKGWRNLTPIAAFAVLTDWRNDVVLHNKFRKTRK